MRHTKQFPGPIVLILLINFLWCAATLAQNNIDPLPDPLPGILLSNDGLPVETAEQWEGVRRTEILELFRDHVYGRVPALPFSTGYEVRYYDRNALGGTAILKEVEVKVGHASDTLAFSLLVFLPKESNGPVPLFLGLNFNGNHTIHPDPQISVTGAWVPDQGDLKGSDHRASAMDRGAKSSRWPVELILSRGYGVATLYAGEIDPDYDDGFENGIHRLFGTPGQERKPGDWGTLAAWAWGLSRAMDYLERDPEVDRDRVAVIGHSRMGKAALWAGAEDGRFAMVVSNNSGCGGAALSRRPYGERVSRINEVFPHWFAERFREYSDREQALPVDQHMLMALMAPRPLYVASALEDDWADPPGEYLSLVYGSKAYGLYGNEVLEDLELPPVDQPRWSGNLGYHIRTGAHDLTRFDWEQYLDFADQRMKQAHTGGAGGPVTGEWIRRNLAGNAPRMILTPEVEAQIRGKLDQGDPVTVTGLQLLLQSAGAITALEPLVYRKTGRRLLGVSREAIGRLATLALACRFERNAGYLEKLEEELATVCSFQDWNPSHFLDVAEMAAGVALALDWAGEWLSPEVEKMARIALVEKALKPGMEASPDNFWIDASHNWNLVCHGGLTLAALAVFEDEPELAARVIGRAVEKIPLALEPYAPGGIYPEGPSYWFYATTYLTLTISALESALGTDFGFTDAPGVMESAWFSLVTAGPSGLYFNYFDAGLEGFQSPEHFGLLSWFGIRSGAGVDRVALEATLQRARKDPSLLRGTRFLSVFFLNWALPGPASGGDLVYPEVWSGGGGEPIVVFRDPDPVPEGLFLAAKGGRAADNHGNMDAGSFIFELDGVRWSVDPGNQDYNQLEQLMGGALWNSAQESQRWSLLTKNNFGHSTLTVNGQMHLADARSVLFREDRRSPQQEATFDLSPVFGEGIRAAHRTFKRNSPRSVRILDHLEFSPRTGSVTWQMMTTAAVTMEKDRLVLRQVGKELYLRVLSAYPYQVEVAELSPPPLPHDKNIPGLKRIELRVERASFPGDSGDFLVELSGDPGI